MKDDARDVLNEVRFRHIVAQRERDQERRTRMERFLEFVRGGEGDPTTAKELEEFLMHHSGLRAHAEDLESTWKTLDRSSAALIHELEETGADFDALQLLEDNPAAFTLEEVEELRCLFGLYGPEFDARIPAGVNRNNLSTRQQFWMRVDQNTANSVRRNVAERATVRLGTLLYQAESEREVSTSDHRSPHG